MMTFFTLLLTFMKSSREELRFDELTSLFTIDINLTPFGAFSVQPSDPITNLLRPNDFQGPNSPRKPPFPERYFLFLEIDLK